MIFKKEPVFPKKRLVGKRPWGTEEMLAIIPGVLTLKKLTIKKKRKGGLQFHRLKNECGILLSGKMQVNYFNKKKKVGFFSSGSRNYAQSKTFFSIHHFE